MLLLGASAVLMLGYYGVIRKRRFQEQVADHASESSPLTYALSTMHSPMLSIAL